MLRGGSQPSANQRVLFPEPVPGDTGLSLDCGTVLGLEGFTLGDGALGAPRPPTPRAGSTAASSSCSACSTTGAPTLCPCAGCDADCQNGAERQNTDFAFHDFLFLNVEKNASKEGTAQCANLFLLPFTTLIRQCHARAFEFCSKPTGGE